MEKEFMNKDLDEAREELNNGVIKCVFVTKDKRKREMWATRNVERIRNIFLISDDSLFTSEKVINMEKKYNQVQVFDLQKRSSRKINLKTLLEWEVFGLDQRVPDIMDNVSQLFKINQVEQKGEELTDKEIEELF